MADFLGRLEGICDVERVGIGLRAAEIVFFPQIGPWISFEASTSHPTYFVVSSHRFEAKLRVAIARDMSEIPVETILRMGETLATRRANGERPAQESSSPCNRYTSPDFGLRTGRTGTRVRALFSPCRHGLFFLPVYFSIGLKGEIVMISNAQFSATGNWKEGAFFFGGRFSGARRQGDLCV